jgi:putative nucleotidyltransferase with HDIG domain
MMLRALNNGAAGVTTPVPTRVALAIARPMLVTMVQEVLSHCPEVEVCLVAHRVVDLATFHGRDRVRIVIGDPSAAKEIRDLLHPGQLLVLLASDDTVKSPHADLVVNMASPNWSSALASFLTAPPTPADRVADRRRTTGAISLRRRVAELMGQLSAAPSDSSDPARFAATSEQLVSMLPGLGCPATLIFLRTDGIPRTKAAATPWLDLLRSMLRREDAVLRLDELTFVVLAVSMEPEALPSLLTRLSWRLWPANPTAIEISSTLWQPGQAFDLLAVPGQETGSAEPVGPPPLATIEHSIPVQPSMPALTFAPEAPSPPWTDPLARMKARSLEAEPWFDHLPGFTSEQSLWRAVEAQEEEEFGHAGHAAGVARVAAALAGMIGLSAAEVEHLRQAALFHDGGKLALDRVLWGSLGTISSWQRRLMEAHAGLGGELADQVGIPDAAVMAILHHHERWDGLGYPAGLAGKDIPILARLLFVAEAVDSMLRPSYRRQPMAPSEVARVLLSGAGELWDPELVHHAVRIITGTAHGRLGAPSSRGKTL